MKKIVLMFLLVPVLFGGESCASWKQNQWLSAHSKALAKLADGNLSAEQKLDGLVQDYVQFMQEDLKFIDPRKGIKYVKKYHDQNRASMDKILKNAENWQDGLKTLDKISLGVRTVQKPYIKSLIDLAPKFQRKYKEYKFALEMASKIGGGLTRFAGKNLF